MPASIRRVVARYLSAARLDQKVRSAANAALIKAGMDGNGKFRSPGTALARISEVLGSHGIKLGEGLQSASLKQPQGQITVSLALTNPGDSLSPAILANTNLSLHWFRLEDSQYEVVAYLS